MRVGTLLKENHTGKLVGEWDKLVADGNPEMVDMSPAVSAFMAVKDADEIVSSLELGDSQF
jgi:nucleosome binding factor SPN SPT16 subunit